MWCTPSWLEGRPGRSGTLVLLELHRRPLQSSIRSFLEKTEFSFCAWPGIPARKLQLRFNDRRFVQEPMERGRYNIDPLICKIQKHARKYKNEANASKTASCDIEAGTMVQYDIEAD